jgi:hypothetical protein
VGGADPVDCPDTATNPADGLTLTIIMRPCHWFSGGKRAKRAALSGYLGRPINFQFWDTGGPKTQAFGTALGSMTFEPHKYIFGRGRPPMRFACARPGGFVKTTTLLGALF